MGEKSVIDKSALYVYNALMTKKSQQLRQNFKPQLEPLEDRTMPVVGEFWQPNVIIESPRAAEISTTAPVAKPIDFGQIQTADALHNVFDRGEQHPAPEPFSPPRSAFKHRFGKSTLRRSVAETYLITGDKSLAFAEGATVADVEYLDSVKQAKGGKVSDMDIEIINVFQP